jgi:hypothetical protein
MNDFDVAVIGGGAARLSAVLVLAWARHRVAVVEVGAQRNAPAAHMHGFLSPRPNAAARSAGRRAGRGERLRRPGRWPPAAEVADALAGRSQIAVALGDLSASSRAALSRTLKAVKAVVGNEITELDFMSEASCIIGMIVRRAESAIWVLLVHRRMLCPSRWVIPGLAAGVTGWPAGQRVAGGSRSSDTWNAP